MTYSGILPSSRVLFAIAAEPEHTTYDLGDLRAELDNRIGDLIEKTAHRYLPRDVARHVRRNMVSDIADKIVRWDNDHGTGEANCHG